MEILKDTNTKFIEYAFYILPDEVLDFYFIFSRNNENENIKLETILYHSKIFNDVFSIYTDNSLITLQNTSLSEEDLYKIINFVKQNNYVYYFDYLKYFDEDYYIYTKHHKGKQIYVYVLKEKPFYVFIDLLYSTYSLISTLMNKDLLLTRSNGIFIDKELVYTKLEELEYKIANVLSLEQKRKIKYNPNLVPVKKPVYNSKIGKTYFQTFYVRKDNLSNKLYFSEFKTNIKDILNNTTTNNFEKKIITEMGGKQNHQMKTKGNTFQIDSVVKINNNNVLSLSRTNFKIVSGENINVIKIKHRKIYNKDINILKNLLEKYENNPILQRGVKELLEKLGKTRNILNKDITIDASINKIDGGLFIVKFNEFLFKNSKLSIFKLFNEFINVLVPALKSEDIQIALNHNKIDVEILNILSLLYLKERDIYEDLKDRDVIQDLHNMKNSIKKLHDAGVINRIEYVILSDIHKTYLRIINSISKQYHKRTIEEKLFSNIITPINYEGISIGAHLLGNWFGSGMLYADLFGYPQFSDDSNNIDNNEDKSKRIEKRLIYNKDWKRIYEIITQ
ncbi:MAG: hypothetical protein QXN68_03955 [Thermoplasmata archaeon]